MKTADPTWMIGHGIILVALELSCLRYPMHCFNILLTLFMLLETCRSGGYGFWAFWYRRRYGFQPSLYWRRYGIQPDWYRRGVWFSIIIPKTIDFSTLSVWNLTSGKNITAASGDYLDILPLLGNSKHFFMYSRFRHCNFLEVRYGHRYKRAYSLLLTCISPFSEFWYRLGLWFPRPRTKKSPSTPPSHIS